MKMGKNTSITIPDDINEILAKLYVKKTLLVSHCGQRPIESKNDLMISCMAKGIEFFVSELENL